MYSGYHFFFLYIYMYALHSLTLLTTITTESKSTQTILLRRANFIDIQNNLEIIYASNMLMMGVFRLYKMIMVSDHRIIRLN